jgi:hypothetical protein
MALVPFGCFTLADARGRVGEVLIAPEYVLLQRAPDASVHDLSYLVVWSDERIGGVVRELQAMTAAGMPVDATSPELRAIFRSIAPTATAVFERSGHCRRSFVRRRLEAALRKPSRLPAGETA